MDRRRLALAIGAGSLVIGLWQPGPVVSVADEDLWLERTDAFADALVQGRWSDLSAAGSVDGATMPGVTTMWVGTAALAAGRAGHALGVLDDPYDTMASPAGTRIAHVAMAIVNAVMVGLLVLLVARLGGAPAGAVAGVLLATEPYLASNGIVLHTDQLVALPGLMSIVALALGLGLHRPEAPGIDRRWVAVSAAALSVSLLTKLNAAALVPGLVPMVGLWWWRERQARPDALAAGLVRIANTFLVTGLVVVAVAWPALWLDPSRQIQAVRDAMTLTDIGHRSFLRGEPTNAPGAEFYPIALLVRLSPWLLAACVAGAASLWLQRRWRPLLACLVLAIAPYAAIITTTSKKFDRYALPVVAVMVLVAALGIGSAWSARRHPPRWGPMAAVALAVLLAVPVVVARPHAHAWVNPLVGAERAERLIPLGRGEGLEQVGRRVAAREAGRCDEVAVAVRYPLPGALPCGRLVSPSPAARGSVDYVVVYVNQRQRGVDVQLTRWAERTGELDLTVQIDGVTYAWLYRVPRSPSAAP